MNFRWHTRLLLALASGALLALAFPNYNLPLLAWIAVCLLILASYGARPAIAPLYGFAHGMVFFPMCLPWMATVMQQYGNVDAVLSAGILGLIGIAGGILVAIFSWGIAVISRKGRIAACLAAPFLWVAVEFLRDHLPIFAFPWNLLGYAASDSLAFLQITTITGIWGLSFLVAAFNALLAYAILSGRHRAWKSAMIAAALLIFCGVGGSYFVPQAQSHHVAHLVQTNFPQYETYPPNWDATHVNDLTELAQIGIEAAKHEPGVIIWPEAPAPLSLQDPFFASRATVMAQEAGVPVLLGVEDWHKTAANKWYATNSAVLLDATGRRVFAYAKIHLVPFGEYVPLRRWLTFAGKITADIGDFTPGSSYEVGELPGTGSTDDKFSTFICYEAIFPGAVRRFTDDGADLLINISNDGWFGRSAAPAQHVMMARVRAVESRRWLLRDTNNGYTVDVDPYGRIVASLATDIRGQLDAPYDFRTGRTLYVILGDWLPWLCVIASVVFLLLPRKSQIAKAEP
ncbi:MAG TPA: apolipoprotein N-acyltransferase [Candidatus Acidoferrales bacterium]